MQKRGFFTLVASVIAMSCLILVGYGQAGEISTGKRIASPAIHPIQPSAEKHHWTEAEVVELYRQMQGLGLPEQALTIEQILDIANAKPYDVPADYLTPEVLTAAMVLHEGEFYLDEQGLHWGDPQLAQGQYHTLGGCYPAYAVSAIWIRGNLEFVFWLTYRPRSYDAYMGSRKIFAEPYDGSCACGILVQKRDILYGGLCVFQPISCFLQWIYVCAK